MQAVAVFIDTAIYFRFPTFFLHSILCVVSAKSFMMTKYLVFVIAFGVLVRDNIRLVQYTGQCKTHADCKGNVLSEAVVDISVLSFESKD
jgi:hypothetical protein